LRVYHYIISLFLSNLLWATQPLNGERERERERGRGEKRDVCLSLIPSQQAYSITKLVTFEDTKHFLSSFFLSFLFWCQFHQHFKCSFLACRSQKRKKTLMTSLSFCAFGICICKTLHVNMLAKSTPVHVEKKFLSPNEGKC